MENATPPESLAKPINTALDDELRALMKGVIGPNSPKMDRVMDLLALGANPTAQVDGVGAIVALLPPDLVGVGHFDDAVTIGLKSGNWGAVSAVMQKQDLRNAPLAQTYADLALGGPKILQATAFNATGRIGRDADGNAVIPEHLRQAANREFVVAAGKGDTARMRYYYDSGVSIDCMAPEFMKGNFAVSVAVTPLMAACRANQTEAALFALELKANPLLTNVHGLRADAFVVQHENDVLLEAVMAASLEQMSVDDAAKLAADAQAAQDAAEAERRKAEQKAENEAKLAEEVGKAIAKPEAPEEVRGVRKGRVPTPKNQPGPLLHPVDLAVGIGTEGAKSLIKVMAKHGDEKALKIEQLDFFAGFFNQ